MIDSKTDDEREKQTVDEGRKTEAHRQIFTRIYSDGE